ncbi:MAG: pyridoxamine 5'-phosphate oxidase family protein [Acidobacteria bacterium]|jgi:nitroimidazol reductase NimA-like FMN-containing flavoprotein (pyridoxamine 5'-phosphate oxidase superfamily)|nr:pyridoxamine 5'-phosphate oxidase family protein [Acidobacteriota bacterium]
MLKIEVMATGEMTALLLRVGFGHLGCTRDDHPYVVPMHYAYDGQEFYFLTTEGTKTEFIAANHEVCFQVEEITDPSCWRSVMLIGNAKKITQPDEAERAMQLISERNPTLTPALNKTESGAWHRPNNIAIYRVEPSAIYGRKTAIETA